MGAKGTNMANHKMMITLEALNATRANTILELLGVEFTVFNEEELVLTMPITNAARQPFGMLHGGVSLVLAESAASSHASWGLDVSQVFPVGIEINGSHLNAATEGTVQVVARPLRRSRTLAVHQVEVTHVESGRLLCSARVTNYYKQVR